MRNANTEIEKQYKNDRKKMMKKWIETLDKRYLKVCVYASVTVLMTVILGALLLSTGGFWKKTWLIFTAVLRPIIIGGIICYLFLPLVNKFEALFNRKKEHKWSRAVGVFSTFLIVLLVIALILLVICVTVYQNLTMINVEGIRFLWDSLQANYQGIWDFILEKMESVSGESFNVTTVIGVVTAGVKSFLSSLLFGIIFGVYFLMDGKHISTYWMRAFRLLFGEKSEKGLEQFFKDADNAFSGYIRGQFLDALLIGVVSAVALFWAGVPNGILVGLFVSIGNLIPYVGPIVGIAMVVIVCLPTAAFHKMLVGLVILAILMFVDGNIVNPKLLSNAVSVHPLLVVAALIAGGAIGGIVGMIVAVPVASLLKVWFNRYLDKKEKS